MRWAGPGESEPEGVELTSASNLRTRMSSPPLVTPGYAGFNLAFSPFIDSQSYTIQLTMWWSTDG